MTGRWSAPPWALPLKTYERIPKVSDYKRIILSNK